MMFILTVQHLFKNINIMKRLLFLSLIIFLTYGCCKTSNENLGAGYLFYVGDGCSTSILNFKNTELIPSHVLDYAFDSVFIIASQRPWLVPGITNRWDTVTYNEHNKIFKKSTFLQYWIINKKEENVYVGVDSIAERAIYSNVYGPYKWKEYLQKRIVLGVPQDLKLEKE